MGFGCQVSGFLEVGGWVAWHGCLLGQVRISCSTKKRARAPSFKHFVVKSYFIRTFLNGTLATIANIFFLLASPDAIIEVVLETE